MFRKSDGVCERPSRALGVMRSSVAHASMRQRREYEKFLNERAVPVFHTFAQALAGEGQRFKVFTPAGSVRLASDGGGDDFIELSFDTAEDRPQVIGRSSRGRGRRQVRSEQPIRDGADVASLTEEDVLDFLVQEIRALVSN